MYLKFSKTQYANPYYRKDLANYNSKCNPKLFVKNIKKYNVYGNGNGNIEKKITEFLKRCTQSSGQEKSLVPIV